MNDIIKFDSPRLQKLDQQLQAGNYEAVDIFWQEIEATATPLMEDLEDDNTEILATFLYKGDEATKNVLLYSHSLIKAANLEDFKLAQMPYTKIWYRSLRVSKDILTTYSLPVNDSLIPFEGLQTDEERTARFQELFTPDPLNPDTFHYPQDPDDPDEFSATVSVLRGTNAPSQPHIEKRETVKKGKIEEFDIESKLLKNTRKFWVYTPPEYQATHKYPLLLLFDGFTYVELVPTPTLLDNLLDEGQIPPMLAIILDNAKDQRSDELPPNETFALFIRDELVPWIREHYSITDKPDNNFVAGSSYGGIAATWIGFKLSNIFGNVISQSGSYWWYPAEREKDKPDADKEPGWLIRQFVESEKLPLRFYMDVGLLENHPQPAWRASHQSMNRHMRDVLLAKGYPLHYVEYCGGHDYIWWRQTLADALVALHSMKNKKVLR